MEIHRFAAIDIGSNAIRLLIAYILEHDGQYKLKKESLSRVPIRLGHDTFAEGKISKEKEEAMISAMKGFKHLMKAHGVEDYRACATSAMREAENGEDVRRKIKDKTGINIEIISGTEEARIIYGTQMADLLDHDLKYLYVDVGGGSTEITYIEKGEMVQSKSFRLGTVRILEGKDKKEEWKELDGWLKKSIKKTVPDYIIGSGGNINKIVKMVGGKKEQSIVEASDLENIYKELNTTSYEDRVMKWNLKPDRADVIIPAMEIFRRVVKTTDVTKIFVPKFGLSDGIVKELYASKLAKIKS